MTRKQMKFSIQNFSEYFRNICFEQSWTCTNKGKEMEETENIDVSEKLMNHINKILLYAVAW